MNRLLSFCLSSLLTLASFGQTEEPYKEEFPVNDKGLIEYTEVVQVDGSSKDELYSRAREWFVNQFTSADDVLQMEDKESGKLIGKARQDVFINTLTLLIRVQMHYTIGIYLKDGRYKYSVTDIKYKEYPDKYNRYITPFFPAEPTLLGPVDRGKKRDQKIRRQYREWAHKSMDTLIAGLKEHMSQPKSLTDKDEDW